MSFTERQIEIITTGIKLIHEGGIQNLTTKNIAKEIGFTEPALYRHFQNKTDILQSILIHHRNEMKRKIGDLSLIGMNQKELLKQMLCIQFEHFSKNPAIATVIFSEGSFQNDTVLSKTVASIVKSKKAMVIAIIENGQEEGSIRKDISAETIATLYLGSIRFTLLDWRLNNCKFKLNRKAKELTTSMDYWM
jgi:AcrR family transcriptional regulator